MSAEWIVAASRLELTWSLPLQESPVPTANSITVRRSGELFSCSGWSFVSPTVTRHQLAAFGFSNPGPNVCSYSPGVSPAIGVDGAPADPFSNEPYSDA